MDGADEEMMPASSSAQICRRRLTSIKEREAKYAMALMVKADLRATMDGGLIVEFSEEGVVVVRLDRAEPAAWRSWVTVCGS